MAEAFICDGIRTAIGRYGGGLADIRADDLAALPLKALVERNSALDPEALDEVVLGCANQAGEDNRNVARMAVLLAGLPQSVPGVTVNRLCASGLEAVGQVARAIRCGEMAIAIAGGVEQMTRAPFVIGKGRSGFDRNVQLEDTTMGWRFINPRLSASHGTESMPCTAEIVADEFAISREDQDAFSLRSHQRAVAAQARGFFDEEILAVETPGSKKTGPVIFSQDERPRADTTLAGLAKLKPLFGPDGTITAGNSSGINDGAAGLVIASEAAAAKYGLRPRARVLGMAATGVQPRIMGIGPITATQKLMGQLGLTIADFDAIELNEAFASQSLAVLRQLGLPDDADHVNPNGGAIALGHPLGMSGTRLAFTLLRQLEATGGKRGLATLCVGVGMGLALAIERV